MKSILLLLIFVITFVQGFAQQYDKSVYCDKDTMWVLNRRYDLTERYKAVRCEQVSRLGIRLELSMAGFQYNKPTEAWLGNKNGLALGLIVPYGKLNFGIRVKLRTLRTQSSIYLKPDVLPANAKVNPTQIDYFAGYSFDFKYNLSAEPYIGYTQNAVRVLDRVKKDEAITAKTGGLIAGVTLNKYFRIKDYQFIAAFVSGGYSFADFSKINPDLARGYGEWAVGIAYKGFTRRFTNTKIR